MRKFVMGDMHGQYEAARALLKYAKVNLKRDQLVFTGDYINRGPRSHECLNAVHRCVEQGAIALMGNHEYAFLLYSQGQLTCQEFKEGFGGDASIPRKHINWLSNLPLIHEDNEYVYVHAAIYPGADVDGLLFTPRREFKQINHDVLLHMTKGKKIVHGHTPRWYVEDDGARINIDLGASVFDKEKASLALVDLTNQLVYRYDFEDNTLNTEYIKKVN